MPVVMSRGLNPMLYPIPIKTKKVIHADGYTKDFHSTNTKTL